MTFAEIAKRGPSEIFELIAPFSESADARLRGNAVQALAALVGGSDKSLHQKAMDEIARVMSAEPGGFGTLDWQRRFVQRCLEALRRLQPAERQVVGRQILESLSSAREPERRAAIARLSLAAMEYDRCFWTAGWPRWLRLIKLARRPGFWSTLWAACWRTAVVWVIVLLTMAYIPGLMGYQSSSEEFDNNIPLVTAVMLAISALLSISGSIRPPFGIRITDTAVSAITLFLLIIVSYWLGLIPDLSARNVLPLCIIGLFLGAAARASRWGALAVAIEPSGSAVGFRSLGAFAVTTVVCILSGRLGMDMRAAGMGWMILAPAATISAWLDVWLENGEPHPLSQGRAPTERRWVVPVVAVCAMLLSVWLIHRNLEQALAMDNGLQIQPLGEVSQPRDVTKSVRILGGVDTNEPATVTAGFGHRIPVEAKIEGSYQIIAQTNPNEQITLFLMSTDQHVIEKSGGDQTHPPIITRELKKDEEYFVCLMPEGQANCSLSTPASLRDFAMLVINGNIWREMDIHAVHTIIISLVPSK